MMRLRDNALSPSCRKSTLCWSLSINSRESLETASDFCGPHPATGLHVRRGLVVALRVKTSRFVEAAEQYGGMQESQVLRRAGRNDTTLRSYPNTIKSPACARYVIFNKRHHVQLTGNIVCNLCSLLTSLQTETRGLSKNDGQLGKSTSCTF